MSNLTETDKRNFLICSPQYSCNSIMLPIKQGCHYLVNSTNLKHCITYTPTSVGLLWT